MLVERPTTLPPPLPHPRHTPLDLATVHPTVRNVIASKKDLEGVPELVKTLKATYATPPTPTHHLHPAHPAFFTTLLGVHPFSLPISLPTFSTTHAGMVTVSRTQVRPIPGPARGGASACCGQSDAHRRGCRCVSVTVFVFMHFPTPPLP